MPESDLLFLSPHLMACLGGAVTGTVDTTYDPDALMDGDDAEPIKRTGDLSLAVSGTSIAGCNGVAVVNHNLAAAHNVVFTGDFSGTLVTPAVPPGLIRKNGILQFAPVTVDSFSIAITSHPTAIIIGEVFVGKWQGLRALPPGSNLSVRPFNVPYAGDYGGLARTRRAEARRYGGSIYLDDASMALMEDWYSACMENSKSSLIVPFPGRDPWNVIWTSFNPKPIAVDVDSGAAWHVDVEWEELPRYRWP